MALAFTYLACDFLENAVADAMFGPQAMAAGFNESFVFVLQVLTRGKFLTLALAGLIIIALWVARWKGPRQPAAPGNLAVRTGAVGHPRLLLPPARFRECRVVYTASGTRS